MKNTVIFFFASFFSVTGMQAMSDSDKTPLRIEQVTSKSCALVRTKSCSFFNKDTRKEDNALLERTTSPRESKSGSCSPRVQMRARASSVAAVNTDQVGILVSVATSK
jgi:hypothetical protein